MPTLSIKLISCFLMVWFPIFPLSVMAQGADEAGSSQDDFGGDPFDGMDVNTDDLQWDVPEEPQEKTAPQKAQTTPTPAQTQSTQPATSTPKQEQSEPADIYNNSSVEYSSSSTDASRESNIQNAIIEGVQITSEKGETTDEKVITGYFIFRDKPSSYFYEVKLREKKLIFEFNDTKTGASPVPSTSEPPIKGFKIAEDKVDVNKEVKGLKPEWHDMIRITFDLEQVPEVHVNDEFSIISFSFKWTTNQEKLAQYIVKDNTPKIILWSSAGVGGVAAGALAYFLLKRDPPPAKLGPLSKDDLPVHDISKPRSVCGKIVIFPDFLDNESSFEYSALLLLFYQSKPGCVDSVSHVLQRSL